MSRLALVFGVLFFAACGSDGSGSSSGKPDAHVGGSCPTACNAPSQCCTVGNSGFCIDVQNDTANCGGCKMACDMRGANTCSAGQCKCGSMASCPSGSTCCAAGCINTLSDSNNCGGCGLACDVGQACMNGTCVCSAAMRQCSGAETCCSTGCADTTSDPANCGSCDVPCNGGTCMGGTCSGGTGGSCNGGTCDPNGIFPECCPTSPFDPNGCTTTLFDPTNCGGCGIVCPNGGGCFLGTCQ